MSRPFIYIIRVWRTFCNSTIAMCTQAGKAGAQGWHCQAFIGELFLWTTICVPSVLCRRFIERALESARLLIHWRTPSRPSLHVVSSEEKVIFLQSITFDSSEPAGSATFIPTHECGAFCRDLVRVQVGVRRAHNTEQSPKAGATTAPAFGLLPILPVSFSR